MCCEKGIPHNEMVECYVWSLMFLISLWNVMIYVFFILLIGWATSLESITSPKKI